MIPHRIQIHIDLKTGNYDQKQLSKKECAIAEITHQPFYGGMPSKNIYGMIVDCGGMSTDEIYDLVDANSRRQD